MRSALGFPGAAVALQQEPLGVDECVGIPSRRDELKVKSISSRW
jgi:hypothetical protein